MTIADVIIPKPVNELRSWVEDSTGQRISRCYQCGKCTAGCPVAYTMDLTPRQVMRALQLGLEDELLRSSTMWICFYCITCSARCPREIDIAKIMEALRIISTKRVDTQAQKNLKLFHILFISNLRRFGHMYELGLGLTYNLLSKHPLAKAELIPAMLAKGKLPLLPHRAKGANKIKNILAKIETFEKQTTNKRQAKS